MTEPAATPGVAPRRWKRYLAAAGLVALLAAGIIAWTRGRDQPREQDDPDPEPTLPIPEDPRIAYSGPYRNISPKVKYTGDAACVDCHVDIGESYDKHPMGRSLTPIADLDPPEPLDKKHNHPFETQGRRFQVIRRGKQVFQRVSLLVDDRPVIDQDHEVHFAIGSGTHGYSYLKVIDGHVFQTPMSWFTQKQIWDISPGFAGPNLVGRPISTDCLFCHSNHVNVDDRYTHRYKQPVFTGHRIGCERCHGPGEHHVAEREAGKVLPDDGHDFTIVNPRRLSWQLRESVCEQCHLQGQGRVQRRGRHFFDYRPGLPLEEFLGVFVKTNRAGLSKSVSHVEEMHQSVCFTSGSGKSKMGCVSCHNPHEYVGPAKRVAHYRARCLTCHQKKGCSAPLADRQKKADSCIDCHMPRRSIADITHAAMTDHRIARRPDVADFSGSGGTSELPIRNFHQDRVKDNVGSRRDLGIALINLVTGGRALQGEQETIIERGLELLDEATRRGPDDAEAWRVRGEALMLQRRYPEAIESLEKALKLWPRHERTLRQLAQLEAARNDGDRARDYWRRAVTANPYNPPGRRGLGLALAEKKDWRGANEQAAAWVKLDPMDSAARQLHVLSLIELGRKNDARSQFDLLRRMKPPNIDDLQMWFNKRIQ